MVDIDKIDEASYETDNRAMVCYRPTSFGEELKVAFSLIFIGICATF